MTRRTTRPRRTPKIPWGLFVKGGKVIANDADRLRDGTCLCGCGREARRVWARDECSKRLLEVHQILNGDVGAMRTALLRRDKGVCACCGLQAEAERQKCALWLHPSDFPDRVAFDRAKAELDALRAHYMARGFPSPDQTWWENDHIREVVRGGGNSLGNLQTLCIPCHKAKTARLARERAQERAADRHRGQRALLGLGQICPKPVLAAETSAWHSHGPTT